MRFKVSSGIKKISNTAYQLIGCSLSSSVIGWGRKATSNKARVYAARNHLPFIALEDGFLRSVDLGVNGAPPLSLVVDDINIYYDSTQSSKLECVIEEVLGSDEGLRATAQHAMDLICSSNLSKYNHAATIVLPPLSNSLTYRVLVIDQTQGDMSVILGGGDSYFSAMLDAALTEHPAAQIIVKIHPDVLSGKKKGYLTDASALTDPRVLLWGQDCSPMHLLKQVDQVYVYTSQMGFEALMLGLPVQCFGLPWYAGWGVSVDRHPNKAQLLTRRTPNKQLWQLFAAAYLQYARYIHPDFGTRGDVFDVIPWLVRNRDIAQQLAGTIYCVGMSFWKRATVKPFLTSHTSTVHFVSSLSALSKIELPKDAKILIWGSRDIQVSRQFANEKKRPLWRMEDGFVRSVGLGSDLFRPLSLVIDRSGMYYDPHSPSDLEQLLLTGQWSTDQLQQAQTYQDNFVAKGVSKYNLGGTDLTIDVSNRTVILIPGQVEDDASVQYGSPRIKTNEALIKTVRLLNPEAYIVYKPHPDVVAGNRKGTVPNQVLSQCVDHVVGQASIVACLRVADQVHTMTSLTGFEALLHGKSVHCYGGPFYAGWGLTTDHYELPQRQRQLSLHQLIAAVIFQYPLYIMPPKIGLPGFAAAESVLNWLSEQQTQIQKETSLSTWLGRKQRKLTALWQLFFSK